ncbi:hypothetical protein L1987_70664 [Smallanthus sonchifolius]|uniref:Uncharacterized protein n=1 Tax=Smallanthus sonchifolius TaxID=185202 RepID=A0ACB9AQA8_9ASTR|nr:hypothetical protein L1987_70664 [Smallanthus sonchifolius]
MFLTLNAASCKRNVVSKVQYGQVTCTCMFGIPFDWTGSTLNGLQPHMLMEDVNMLHISRIRCFVRQEVPNRVKG